ncbi:flavin monoamine oxidase family protein [Aquimarina sp. 2201CG5-10]|uniref:flavin monoamine oxidase family protein n=1 Tax=Aquimarina callyspongiae TaxID=3098150 RepID=UPI002AB46858|nr:FAD-dependent oxidoreductase [Aquimarina sp. 2201CG5-10]MDY8136832.1 FAD-dependent oxidoreductase [Aquimarina sp. 2201CG5-10]
MKDSNNDNLQSFLRQTGKKGGELELITPILKEGKRLLTSNKIPKAKALESAQEIVILGGGIAGLTLAYEFLNHPEKYRVTILEAENRLGGRSLTLRPGDSFTEYTNHITQTCEFDTAGVTGVPYLNAGPGRIPSGHRNVLNYCKALNVDLEVYVMESRSNLMKTITGFGGTPVVDRQLANDPRGYFAEYLYQNAAVFLKYMNTRQDKEKITDDDIKKLQEWLTSFGALDEQGRYVGSSRSGYEKLPGTEEGIVEPPLPFKEILESVFWELNFYQPEDFLWQQTSFQPVGGMDKIVQALEREVMKKGGIVHLDSPVQEIKRVGNEWYIKYGEKGAIKANICVSNIPIPLLKNMVGEKDFSKNYWLALNTVINTKGFLRPTCKVGWQSDRKYWQDPIDEQTVPIFGGISRIQPNKMEQMWYPSNDYHDNTGILTGAYNYGSKAEEWGKENPDARMKEARAGAAKLHGKEFATQLRHGLSIAWQNIKSQQGGWVDWEKVTGPQETLKTSIPSNRVHYDRVRSLVLKTEPEKGSSEWCYNELQKEDNGFFITGDQVSHLPGWQEGAMASALQIYGMVEHPTHILPLKLYKVPSTRALVEGR